MDANDFKGKSWKQAYELCRSQTMLIACSPDPVLREAAKLIKDHGAKAGAAYIAAALYAEDNDPLMVVATGSYFYEKCLHHPKLSREAFASIASLASGVAWGGHFSPASPSRNWPVRISEKTLRNNHGILNFLLHEGLKRLDTSTARGAMVAMHVADFLKWVIGFNEKKSSRDARSVRKHL